MEKVLIIKQKKNEDVWVKLRNLAWEHDKELFDMIDDNTFEIVNDGFEHINFKLKDEEDTETTNKL